LDDVDDESCYHRKGGEEVVVVEARAVVVLERCVDRAEQQGRAQLRGDEEPTTAVAIAASPSRGSCREVSASATVKTP
jgi:hypothetical protein